jgi:hypothetical protein
MQQRRLRLGDILDDYCPRERRITNHAVVAMIDDQVKQTRCTTCDADHEYKQARVPPQRRKRPATGGESVEAAAHRLRAMGDAPAPADGDDFEAFTEVVIESSEDLSAPGTEPDPDPESEGQPFMAETAEPESEEFTARADNLDDDGPVHRRLIRATLPRPDGQTPDRREPEFTIRHPGMRGREFGKGPGGRRQARGPGSGPPRFGAPRQGPGGPRSGQDQRPSGNRAGRPDGQRGNRAGSRGRGRKRGR